MRLVNAIRALKGRWGAESIPQLVMQSPLKYTGVYTDVQTYENVLQSTLSQFESRSPSTFVTRRPCNGLSINTPQWRKPLGF